MLRTAWRKPLIALGVSLGVFLLAEPAHALYLYFQRRDLDKVIREDPDSIVGKQVVFTDELSVIWPQVQQRPDMLDGERHVLFDTEMFKCAVPANRMETHLQSIWDDAQKGYGEVLTQLEEINDQLRAKELTDTDAQTKRRDLYWALYKVWSNKPIVTVFGTVARADFWGPVADVAKGAGVQTEQITIVVDKVEKPRTRWYEEGLDEQPFNDRLLDGRVR